MNTVTDITSITAITATELTGLTEAESSMYDTCTDAMKVEMLQQMVEETDELIGDILN
jgi:hypothetical protein